MKTRKTIAEILTKSLLETNTYLIQILKDYFDSTLYIQLKSLKRSFYFLIKEDD